MNRRSILEPLRRIIANACDGDRRIARLAAALTVGDCERIAGFIEKRAQKEPSHF